MKKLIIVTAASLMIAVNTLRAQDSVKVSAIVTDQFSKQFDGVSNLRWEKVKNQVSMARFRLDNENWLAYFDREGQLVASARYFTTVEKLPIMVKRSLETFRIKLEQKHGDFGLVRIYELIKQGHTTYYASLQNDIISITISIDSNGYAVIQSKASQTKPSEDLKPFLARRYKN